MHSNTESSRDGQAGRSKGTTTTTGSGSTPEPQLADTITGTRETARRVDAGFTDAARDDGRRMTTEREAQIRQRVQDGTYNSLSMVDELARRLIRSADL